MKEEIIFLLREHKFKIMVKNDAIERYQYSVIGCLLIDKITFMAFEFYVILRFFRIQQYIEVEDKLILIHCPTFSYTVCNYGIDSYLVGNA